MYTHQSGKKLGIITVNIEIKYLGQQFNKFMRSN